jgi:hypothetical protein
VAYAFFPLLVHFKLAPVAAAGTGLALEPGLGLAAGPTDGDEGLGELLPQPTMGTPISPHKPINTKYFSEIFIFSPVYRNCSVDGTIRINP